MAYSPLLWLCWCLYVLRFQCNSAVDSQDLGTSSARQEGTPKSLQQLKRVLLKAAPNVRVPLGSPRLPCCGLVATPSRELVVVGTVHTLCNSSLEVKEVITSTRPDVVVVEIDQERLEPLLEGRGADGLYGGDLAMATIVAILVDAVVVLGDAPARETLQALTEVGPIANARRLARAFQLKFLSDQWMSAAISEGLRFKPVSEISSFLQDPAKLWPISVAFLPLGLIVLLESIKILATAKVPEVKVPDELVFGSVWADALALAVTIAISLRVFDILLLSRDDILSGSSLRALELARGLRTGKLLRRRFRFSTDPARLSQAPAPQPGSVPFFTLRAPLEHGEVRQLNLFEPRWLSLLDTLAAANSADGDLKKACKPEQLINATFGCAVAVNRYYGPAIPKADVEGEGDRMADVVLLPVGRLARILKAEQSTRPVSGDRRLQLEIIGEDPVRLNPSSLSPTKRGYLAGNVAPCTESEYAEMLEASTSASSSAGDDTSEPLARVVSVVGMAHANGVLTRCAETKLQGGLL